MVIYTHHHPSIDEEICSYVETRHSQQPVRPQHTTEIKTYASHLLVMYLVAIYSYHMINATLYGARQTLKQRILVTANFCQILTIRVIHMPRSLGNFSRISQTIFSRYTSNISVAIDGILHTPNIVENWQLLRTNYKSNS